MWATLCLCSEASNYVLKNRQYQGRREVKLLDLYNTACAVTERYLSKKGDIPRTGVSSEDHQRSTIAFAIEAMTELMRSMRVLEGDI